MRSHLCTVPVLVSRLRYTFLRFEKFASVPPWPAHIPAIFEALYFGINALSLFLREC